MIPRYAWWLALVATGCQQLLGLERPVQQDASVGDVGDGNSSDGSGDICVGSSFERVCLRRPDQGVVLADAIDTDGARCESVTSITTPACVIAGTTVEVQAIVATGSRPLVLISLSDFLLGADATIDVSSTHLGQVGAGAVSSCPFAANPTGGGGGAGGSSPGSSSFVRGGSGGTGLNSAQGGSPGMPPPATTLRGGCRGQHGDGMSSGAGSGGGAVYILSTTRIEISGAINASGAGGLGGLQPSHGACGGGAGGMIVLDAPMVVITSGAAVYANGGGGGEGAGCCSDGANGNESSGPSSSAVGGAGTSINAGDGGGGASDTSVISTVASAGVAGASTGAGGGGGGGVGIVEILGQRAIASGTVSPSPD